MHNIYVKLGLEELDRDQRVLQIHNVYCPLLSAVKENKKRSKNAQIGLVEAEPEPLLPDEEKIIDGDEVALISYKPQTIIVGGKKKEMDGTKKKKRGCFKYIFGFILGVACTIGAWQGWLYVKDIPVVQSIIEIINPDLIQEPVTAPTKAAAPYTQPVAEPTAAPAAKSAEKASEPVAKVTATTLQTTNFKNVTELNDWYKQDDVWLRMFDYQVSAGMIQIRFEIWNKTSQDLYFSWSPLENFSLVDNEGTRYKAWNSHSYDEQIGSEERLELRNMGPQTLQYHDDPMYGAGVTDLYVTVEYLSRIDKAVFHIPVGK